MGKVKFGIVGAGILAPLHANAITANPHAELVAIADLDYQKATIFAEKYHIKKIFTDLEEMLSESIDVVCICVPSGLHAAVTVKCAAMGKHVLCEKPLDITFEHMDAMIHACKKANVKLGTVFQRRTMPHVIAAKEAFDQGSIGELMMLHANLKYFRDDAYYASAGWRGKWDMDGGGALMNQGVHGVDLLQWIGGPIESVFAYSDTLTRKNIEVEDTAVAILKFINGGFGVIQGATSVYPEQDTSIEINGNTGTIRVSDKSVDIWEFMKGENCNPVAPELPGSDYDGHYLIIKDMIEAIQKDEDPMVTGIEARKSVQLILAIYESARKNKEIKLAEFNPFHHKKGG